MKLYTGSDVMQIFGITRKTLYNWIEKGTIKGVKIGQQWRFHQSEIDRLLNQGSK